jgi:hypothetical protein
VTLPLHVSTTSDDAIDKVAGHGSGHSYRSFTRAFATDFFKLTHGEITDEGIRHVLRENGLARNAEQIALAGSNTQVGLPSAGLNNPWGVAVDTAGDVYVTNASNSPVLKLSAGSNTQVELPFTGLNCTGGVAADTAGDVDVAE